MNASQGIDVHTGKTHLLNYYQLASWEFICLYDLYICKQSLQQIYRLSPPELGYLETDT